VLASWDADEPLSIKDNNKEREGMQAERKSYFVSHLWYTVDGRVHTTICNVNLQI
jgi:hypothetical protein